MYNLTDDFIKQLYHKFKNRVKYEDLIGVPELFSGDYNDLSNKPVIFDGDYNSLSNKPQIVGANFLKTAMICSSRCDCPTSSGYARLFKSIRIDYAEYPMIFYISVRSNSYMKCVIKFGYLATDSITYFKCKKYDFNRDVYLVKTASKEWSLYIKLNTFDWTSVAGIRFYDGGTNLDFTPEFITSLPSGYIKPTEDSSII